MHHFSIKRTELDYVLVSRKDVRRLGRRYLVRGADKNGAVANAAETEQILIQYEDGGIRVASYLQYRGSIPLLWSQKPNLQYDPPIIISPDQSENVAAARKHFEELKSFYGKVKVVNLIDKKGKQDTLGKAFGETLRALKMDDSVGYEWFDFHSECKNMKWENMSKLIAALASEIECFDYFMALVENSSGSPSNKGFKSVEPKNIQVLCMQAGVIRTNCVDSLDRTGVVQSVIARNILHRQLHKLGLEGKPEANGSAFSPFVATELETIFRNLWTDNGDQLSVLYTGTKALKTDFTRTGKRTFKGAILDGKHSVQRYYINQLRDGYYQVPAFCLVFFFKSKSHPFCQDCIDVASGAISPQKILIKDRSPLTPMLLSVFLLVLAWIFTKLFNENVLPNHDKSWKGTVYHMIAYAVSAFIAFRVLLGTALFFFEFTPQHFQ